MKVFNHLDEEETYQGRTIDEVEEKETFAFAVFLISTAVLFLAIVIENLTN